ncbi:hypothetical protein D3C87_1922000 [compost metagenome]
MIVTHHFADDLGAFAEGGVRPEAHLAHRIDDTAMDRLQSVTDVRQRAVHDGGQRIGEIALFERCLEVHR